MTQFDWRALFCVGTRQLGLQPSDFWALTPAELRLMLGEVDGQAPMRMAGLEALMERFPDQGNGKEEEGST
ncbi:rcc01693 family protein [Shimia ponticola]|uniref:rcc01693 family protein n=1 Tax=Shimia ponticola TaxID=2582893 RepID=UPI0011BF22EA|nr:rcc01693 family protein [Shimia ponticola]